MSSGRWWYVQLWRVALLDESISWRYAARLGILAVHASVIVCLIVGLWIGERVR